MLVFSLRVVVLFCLKFVKLHLATRYDHCKMNTLDIFITKIMKYQYMLNISKLLSKHLNHEWKTDLQIAELYKNAKINNFVINFNTSIYFKLLDGNTSIHLDYKQPCDSLVVGKYYVNHGSCMTIYRILRVITYQEILTVNISIKIFIIRIFFFEFLYYYGLKQIYYIIIIVILIDIV